MKILTKPGLFLLSILFALQLMGQTQPTSETFRSNDPIIHVDEQASFHIQYLMDEFTDGTIYLKNGRSSSYNINYNILLDEIHYQNNGETLKLSAIHNIDSVRLGQHTLIPFASGGFVEVFNTSEGPLLLHRYIHYKGEILKRGAYGSIERTSAVDRVSSIITNEGGRGFGTQQDVYITNSASNEMEVIMRFRQNYYIQKDNEFIELSNRRATSRAFPENQRKVNNFIRQNNIDFDSVESLKELAVFLYSL